MTKPTLLVMAAGMGSRYGGLKQIDPVGPSGETLMDYSIFDAIRGGFGKIVFVIRKDIEAPFRETIGAKFEKRIPVDYVYQELDKIPSGFKVPEGAVVVQGSRAITKGFGKESGLSIYAPIIVKYRDEKTDASTRLEYYLR